MKTYSDVVAAYWCVCARARICILYAIKLYFILYYTHYNGWWPSKRPRLRLPVPPWRCRRCRRCMPQFCFPRGFLFVFRTTKNRRESRKDAADVHCCERHIILLTFLTLAVHMRPAAAHHAHDPLTKGSRRRREGDDDDRTCICRTRQHHWRCCVTKYPRILDKYKKKTMPFVIGTRSTVNYCTADGDPSYKLSKIPFTTFITRHLFTYFQLFCFT